MACSPDRKFWYMIQTRPGASRANQTLLLLILFLDLVGFTLIFPLFPHLLGDYMNGAPVHSLDAYLPNLKQFLLEMLPVDRRQPDDLIKIMGGMLASIYSILMFLVSPWWGRLSDRIGRRPVLLISSLGLALSYLLWLFSESFTLFVFSRILGGIMAGNMGVASAAMADTTTVENRTKAMGMVGAAFGLGMILGPVLGGGAMWIYPGELLAEIPGLHRFSLPAGLAFLLSMGSVILNKLRLEETLDPENRNRHNWIENPISIARRNFKNPNVFLILMLNLFYLFAFSAFEFCISFFYKIEFGMSEMQIGLVFLYIGVILVIGQGGLVRALAKRVSSRVIVLIGLFLMPAPLVWFANTAPLVGWSLAALVPISIGAALFQPGISGLMSLHTTADRQGLALSTLRSAGSLGRALGPLVGAYLYWYFSIEVTYLAVAIVMLVLFAMAFLLKNPEGEHVSKK